MTATQVLNQATKMNITIKEPQAHMIASVVNNKNTRVHFVNQANPTLIKLYNSLTA